MPRRCEYPELILSILALGLFGSQEVIAAKPEITPQQEEAIIAVAKELERVVVPLTHSVYVFHWSSLGGQRVSSAEEIDLHSQTMMNLGRGLSNYFWNNRDDRSTELVGHGLYCSRDPMASTEFAGSGDSWVLGVIEVPVGTKLIDLRATKPRESGPYRQDYERGNRIAIKPETIALVNALGCGAKPYWMFDDWLTRPDTCAPILYTALARLGVQGTIHHWLRPKLKGCFTESSTFTLFDPNLFSTESVTTFTARSPELLTPGSKEAKIAAFVYAMTKEAEEGVMDGMYPITRYWKAYDAQLRAEIPVYFNAADLQAEKNEKIFNCSHMFAEDPVREAYPYLGREEPTD